jgi:hypothetical protein
MKLTTFIIAPLALSLLVLSAAVCSADSSANERPTALIESASVDWIEGVKVSTSYMWLDESEYLPELAADGYTWQERNYYVQLSKSIASGSFGLGYIDGTIKQENEFYNDIDFALTRKAPFAMLSWQWSDKLTSTVRVRREEYSDDGRAGFYLLGKDQTLWTGYGRISYVEHNWWLNVSYARERDPEPVYDATNERAALDISAQTLSGMTLGWLVHPQWETAAGIYYESYGSTRPNQFNYTVQLTHKPLWLPRLQAALGVGYYTQEKDTLVNLTVDYSQPINKALALRFEYQLEYSSDEQSVLNQGRVILAYAITKQFSLNISGEYGKESGDDHDDSLFALASLDWRFY